MTEFSRQQLNDLRNQLQSALDGADLPNITIDVGNCRYSGGEAKFQVKCTLEGAKTREMIDLEYYADLYNIDINKTAKLQGEDMKLSGYKSRARKKPFVLQRLRDGAAFVCTSHVAEQFFKKAEEIRDQPINVAKAQ